jgi:transcriptional regulator with GAF, ATPase, and Fis domain
MSLDEYEKNYIVEVLRRTGGAVYGPDGAAKILGMKPSTLQSRMKKLAIDRKQMMS